VQRLSGFLADVNTRCDDRQELCSISFSASGCSPLR
jgi:hypothetical protein